MKALKIDMNYEETITRDDADQIGDVLSHMVLKINAKYPDINTDISLLIAIEMLRKMLLGYMQYEAEESGIAIGRTDLSDLKDIPDDDDKGPLQ